MNFSILVIILTINASLIFAHVEEMCISDNGEPINLYQPPNDSGCRYRSLRPLCIFKALQAGGQTFSKKGCRGIIHFDSVYYIAQALGFNSEIAYWIAAFSQSTDFVQYVPYDNCGNPLSDEFKTPPLKGMMRTSALTGGSVTHLGIIHGENRTNVSGLKPKVTDENIERNLANFRKWAFGQSDKLCTAGIKDDLSDQDECIKSSKLFFKNVSQLIVGPIPITQNAGYLDLGDQIMHFDCIDSDPNCTYPSSLTNKITPELFEQYLNNSKYAKLKDKSPVPQLIARVGMYMHALADRVSHYYCTNSPKTNIHKLSNQSNDFILIMDSIKGCDIIKHGMEHYWEQAVKPQFFKKKQLAPQSWAALNYFWDELSNFKSIHIQNYPQWFSNKENFKSKDEVIGSQEKLGILPDIATIVDAKERWNALQNAYKNGNFSTLPGWDTECNRNWKYQTQ